MRPASLPPRAALSDLVPELSAGIGLKAPHYAGLLDRRPALGFLEIHAENFMGAGGPPHRWLSALTEHYPLSVHGVGLSLGSPGPLDHEHLEALARVVERTAPTLVSEHLAWCRVDGLVLNDLLPIPYSEESLEIFCDHLDETQERLGRPILIENPSAYIAWADSVLSEPEFLSELVRRTGCGLLLDVNNLYVSSRNLGLDPIAYLEALPGEVIGEIHLAGHHLRALEDGREIRIDDHGSPVCAAVWDLYRQTITRFGPRPTLIEWDTDVPALAILLEEAAQAQAVMAELWGEEARHAVA